MDARRLLRDRRGQSILEFLLMMPMMLGLTALMLRVNTAVQMSVVNQQYARAQALFLTFNHAEYPDRPLGDEHRMTLGVSDNVAPANPADKYNPEPMIQAIARPGGTRVRGPAGEEPTQRTDIRVRNTVALCAPSRTFRAGGQSRPITSITEGVRPNAFAYCRSRIDE